MQAHLHPLTDNGVLPWLPNAIIVGVGMAASWVVKDHSPLEIPPGVLRTKLHACFGKWRSALGLTLYAMRGGPLQHEPPKALQRSRGASAQDLGDTHGLAIRSPSAFKPEQMRDVALYF
jgi:hypothetical protein